MVFVPEQFWVSSEEEKKRYEQHNNTPENEGYLKYLGQITDVVDQIEKASPRILDFGSGKTAVLTGLLKKKGYDCTPYDPLFGIKIENNEQPFDIIILCEVIEHLRAIRGELELIKSLQKKDGVLIIRTRLYPSLEKIENWWYAQDKTHINFFTNRTIEEVATFLNRFRIKSKAEDIFVLD